jgi:hypothetical protein
MSHRRAQDFSQRFRADSQITLEVKRTFMGWGSLGHRELLRIVDRGLPHGRNPQSETRNP